VPGKVHVRKLGKSKFLKQAQWLVLDTSHNVMVFTIRAKGVWSLNNGQVDPRRLVHWAL
jgi:hypothetical protein